MYDMYPWAKGEWAGEEPFPRAFRGDGSHRKEQRGIQGGRPPGLAHATHAVQVALDRRDNGGDAGAAGAGADAAGTPAEPTAGPTRQ